MKSPKMILGGVLLTASMGAFAHGHCGDTALHEDMETLKTEMKSLAFEVKKEKFEAADARIDTIIAALRDAREETPYLFKEKELAGEELAARQADYQSVIDDTITAFEALDAAVMAKDAGAARTALGEVGNLRKKGHRAFKADC